MELCVEFQLYTPNCEQIANAIAKTEYFRKLAPGDKRYELAFKQWKQSFDDLKTAMDAIDVRTCTF